MVTSEESSAMPDAIEGDIKLCSSNSSRLLQQVASLRANGVANHINLPQLVVCGDQSAGKSSVLNGLIRIPFPRADGVCTKFATEIIVEHTDAMETTIIATIIPHADRDDESARVLKAFHKPLQNYKELPDTISEVASLMGLRGYAGNTEGPGFALDVLRINVSGKTGMHLSVVDLSGLISVTADERHREDTNLVHRLVDSYLANPRTIILAVMQAGNDFDNQPIIGKARRFDPDGERTVGIITKPDLINKGCEERIARLSRNQHDFKLKLGFFVVKNPEPQEIRDGLSYDMLQDNEVRFFRGQRWCENDLDQTRVGISSLRKLFRIRLDHHILSEMPKMKKEIRKALCIKKKELDTVGAPRQNETDLRIFLTNLSQKFQAIVSADLSGHYDGLNREFFGLVGKRGGHVRLRGAIQNLNTAFRDFMDSNGAKRKLANGSIEELSEVPARPRKKVKGSTDDSIFPTPDSNIRPARVISREEMMDWVSKVHASTRGLELQGESNPVLISQLFHEQSSRWFHIGKEYILDVDTNVAQFMRDALDFILPEDVASAGIHSMLDDLLEQKVDLAEKELQRLAQDEMQHPITYNQSYIDDVQRARQDMASDIHRVVQATTTTHSGHGKDTPIVLDTINTTETHAARPKRISAIDKDERNCLAAFNSARSYYKIACARWVDNVCIQVVEKHLLQGLVYTFDATAIAAMSEQQMACPAAETPNRAEKRRELANTVHSLQEGLKDLSS